MRAITFTLCLLLFLLYSCNEKINENITLSNTNHLTEQQLYQIAVKNVDQTQFNSNFTERDSMMPGTEEPVPPCPDDSFTDCCPSLRYITFKKGTKDIKIYVLDKNGKTVQEFDESDLKETKNGDLIFPLKLLRNSICSGESRLKVQTGKEHPYLLKFSKK